MMSLHEQLITAIVKDNVGEVSRLIQDGLDLNVRCDQGASALFVAILQGNITILQLMLEHGADPNLVADEPAATIYAEKPLELAMQSRFLLDWEIYHPIVKLLEQYRATDSDGCVESGDKLEVRKRRAKEWQNSL
jgi:hypothetical protein